MTVSDPQFASYLLAQLLAAKFILGAALIIAGSLQLVLAVQGFRSGMNNLVIGLSAISGVLSMVLGAFVIAGTLFG